MTVETVVQEVARKSEHSPLVPKKYAERQWVAQIKNTKHATCAGINPLADAAAILFTTITELRQQTEAIPASSLQKRLIRELNAYQQQIQQHKYNDEEILVSRYCLCAAADEIISNTSWGGNQYWDEHRLLLKLHQDSSKGKRFFPILHRVQKEPEKFIDLLELIYFCLSFGFKGQYRNTLYGTSQLNMTKETIYHQIRSIRGELSRTISPQLKQQKQPAPKKTASFWHNFLITIGITLLVIAIITGSFSYLFKLTSKQIFEHNAAHTTSYMKPINTEEV